MRIDDIREFLGGYLKILGDITSTFGQRAGALLKINSVIHGWRNYFCLPDETGINEQLRLADGAVEEMAQEHLPASIMFDPA